MEELAWEGRFIQVKLKNDYECVERVNISGIVVLAAVTDDGELLLVEQFRPPIDGRILELPAGLAGDSAAVAGEAIERAAVRELEEETGYRPGSLQVLGEFEPTAGVMRETYTMYLCRDLEKVGEGGGDESEDIVVHAVPLGQVPAFISAKRGEGLAIDAKIHAALWHIHVAGLL